MLTSRRTVHVDWGDCDPANIVFYPRYFAWFDASTAHHFKFAGLPKPELIRRYGVVGVPLVETGAKFFAPSSYGDEIEIETTFTGFGRSSFEAHHRVFRGETLTVEGFEKRVLVEKVAGGGGIRGCPIPDEIRRLFD